MESQEILSTSEISLFKKKFLFSMSEFEIIITIGKGSQGEVYEASSMHFPDKIAIKSIRLPKNNFKAQKILKRIQSEIIINTQIQESDNKLSIFFPQFYGYFVQDETFNLIFQLCSYDAAQVYNKLKNYDQKYTFCWILLYDMIKSLSLLEKKQVFHGDIKPQNILFKDNFFKLTDLGLAKQTLGSRNITLDAGNIFSKAPQIYIGKYNTKSDIWSLGITLYYLLEGKLPYDNDTIQMMFEEDKIEMYIERMKNKQFFLDLCEEQVAKKQILSAFPLYQIMKKMLNVSLEERSFASQIDSEFFTSIQNDQICQQQIIKEIVQTEKPVKTFQLGIFLRNLVLKYLDHRQSELGLFYVIFFGCIKQILRINKKLFKIRTFLQKNFHSKNNEKILETQLLKNIKNSCFKLIEVLFKQMQDQSAFNQTVLEPITSFGQIHLSIQPSSKFFHEDHKKLEVIISIFLQKYDQYLIQNDEKENIQMEKPSHGQTVEKQVNFDEFLFRISDKNLNNKLIESKEYQKSVERKRSQKKVSALQNLAKQKLPKSIKQIKNQEFQKGKSNEVLQNLLKFYSKDNVKERFSLLGQLGQLLIKLIESSEDPLKRKMLVSSDFRLWNLNLDLFKL